MTDSPFYISVDDPPAKRRILTEGLRLFAERGLSDTSIRDIAAATGYSNPALYKHFRTKEDLASALFEQCYRELMRQVSIATARETGFDSRFRGYLQAYATFYDAFPDALIFVTDNLATLWPRVAERFSGRTMITLTRELLQDGQKQGGVRTDIDVSLQMLMVTGTLVQLARQLYLGGLTGAASDYLGGIENLLRAGLR